MTNILIDLVQEVPFFWYLSFQYSPNKSQSSHRAPILPLKNSIFISKAKQILVNFTFITIVIHWVICRLFEFIQLCPLNSWRCRITYAVTGCHFTSLVGLRATVFFPISIWNQKSIGNTIETFYFWTRLTGFLICI